MLETVNSSGAFGAGLVLLFIIVWFVVVIGSLVMLIVAIVDIVKRPDWQWKLAGQEKILWLLLVILVNVLAIPALIYWFNIRKRLIAVEAAAVAGQYGPGQMTVSGWVPGPGAPAPYASVAAPGWYPDPSREHPLRWWDGGRWTEHTRGERSPPS
jgi:hypothetical protein